MAYSSEQIAAALYLSKYITEDDKGYHVPSKSRKNQPPHLVEKDLSSCNCESFQYRGKCAHILAVKYYQERKNSLVEVKKDANDVR